MMRSASARPGPASLSSRVVAGIGSFGSWARALELRGRGRSTTMPRPTSSSAPCSRGCRRRPSRTPPTTARASRRPRAARCSRRRRPSTSITSVARARRRLTPFHAPSTSSRVGIDPLEARELEGDVLLSSADMAQGRTAGPSVVAGSVRASTAETWRRVSRPSTVERERHAADVSTAPIAMPITAPSASQAPGVRVAGRRPAAGRGSARRRSRQRRHDQRQRAAVDHGGGGRERADDGHDRGERRARPSAGRAPRRPPRRSHSGSYQSRNTLTSSSSAPSPTSTGPASILRVIGLPDR